MTLDEAIKYFEEMVEIGEIYEINKGMLEEYRQLAEWLKELKAYREQGGDAINRQAVLEYIEGSDAELGHSSENELVCQDIKELPPVTPQPEKICVASIHFDEDKLKEICKNAVLTIVSDNNIPTIGQKMGRWIKTRLDDEPDKICDDCGTYCWKCSICGSDKSGWGTYKHCPDCGTKMEVEE